MISVADLKRWFEKHRERIKKDYFHFLRFRSISTDPAFRKDCEDCAAWLKSYLEKGGLSAEVIPTPGLPLVYAEDLHAGTLAKTALLYGHYDVQPVDPIELWNSPPFEPTERDGSIFARGAVDDKGQIFYGMVAVLCLKELLGQLPVNLKFCIEGEEECSSIGLSKMLPKLSSKMRADYLLAIDFDQFERDIPAVSLGARGLVALEATITASKIDMHSGLCGGVAYNPNRALAELIAKLWDDRGRVQVPGFYDAVEDFPEEEKAFYAERYTREYYEKQFGIRAFGGEKGFSLLEVNCFRPTLEINGISGGYTGSGMKTVIPAKAHVKITCRLVPNQDPEKIGRAIEHFLKEHLISGMELEVVHHGGEPAYRCDRKSKVTQAIVKASEEVTKAKCHYTVSGASGPIIPALVRAVGAQGVGVGYGLIDDAIHAPNEHFDMHRFEQGFLTIGRTIGLLGDR